jgi:NTP pyrophosphatase (non-canonical NTP hydrolase)
MSTFEIGQRVTVYDRYRFAIPLIAEIIGFSHDNDGVQLKLLESNSVAYPIGSTDTWVSEKQIRSIIDALPTGKVELVQTAPGREIIENCANFLADVCHGVAVESGWWTNPQTGESLIDKRNVPEMLCLIHSEISEAMEGHRKNQMDDKLQHRKMIEVELADAMIRILDLAGGLNLDLAGAMAEKLAFNTQRPDHKLENRVKDGGKAY